MFTLFVDPTLTKEEVSAAAGSNAEYYWSRWTPLMQGQNWTSFNWAAFFLTGFWLAYRKMYNLATVFFVILTLGVLADHLHPENKETFASSCGWLIALVCGAGGNRWYWSHVNGLVNEARAENADEQQRNKRLSKAGGTSLLSAAAFLAAFFGASLAIVTSVR